MAASEIVQVDDGRVVLALKQFSLSLSQTGDLMQEIGKSQLLSIRRTFREGGSPAGSWVPLSPNTIKSNPKVYGPGHKLLIRSGRLLKSIGIFQEKPNEVRLGTNVKYAAVHQFGSRDRKVGIGPATEAQSKAKVKVGAHSRLQSFSGEAVKLKSPGYATERLEGPALRGKRSPSRRIKLAGPSNQVTVKLPKIGPRNRISVAGHERLQNIPPRPFLVFRPEDPARIRGMVSAYVNREKEKAGLGGNA